ncbi:MAG: Glycosyl transferases group 1 [Candidatus Argoarchaeum ethanivorans]|uniref:Glycosyl transferases group 1 n=1 Tax=Candidatus Argoarchaeum ethanivorans TaxID=2608793 RepID=A0A811T7Q5_9EURY|nr:MAG: Glycosyl transferases group 1 [Candidatus Argoarchaeum ethanivorans]
MKKIYLDVAGKMHSLYNEMINYPPEGYEFISEQVSWDKRSKSISNTDFIYSFQKNVLGKLMPVNIAKAYLDRFKKIPPDVDLTYSSGHLVFREEPWIIDLEFVTHLTGYSYRHFKRYRRTVEKILKSENCKKIMPWTDAGKKTILLTIKDKEILDKVETVHLAVHKKNFTKQYDEDKIKLLFVGSANIPKDFDIKGGKEVLEAFSKLNENYDNLELVIRSYVPPQMEEKYKKVKNIKVIDNIVPWAELEAEFKSADIFLFPSHNTPGLAILDAMSYELPVITTDVWANPELVSDGETGFVIKKSDKIQYYTENFIPNWSAPKSLEVIKKITDPNVVKELVEKAGILIEDGSLRKKMGKAGRQEIETGKFSIEERNEKLKNVFDEATGR